jgi:hypothetical protein
MADVRDDRGGSPPGADVRGVTADTDASSPLSTPPLPPPAPVSVPAP